MSKWHMTRVQYGFGLGILVATWIHFPSPRALFVFAIAGALTALRFHSLGWKPARAFVPCAIALVGTALTFVVGPHSKASVPIAHLWRFLAIVSQSGMTLGAVFAWASIDPRSRKTDLALDFMAKWRRLRRSIRETKPVREAHSREVKKLVAINQELQAYVAANGHVQSEQRKAIHARFEAQRNAMAPLSAEIQLVNERLKMETQELKDASQAWRDRKRRAA